MTFTLRLVEIAEPEKPLVEEVLSGTYLEAEWRLGEIWNATPAAVGDGERYQAQLIDARGKVRMTIGGGEDEDLCRDCGQHYPDGGDGYNGRCPDCADKAEEEGRSDD